MKKKLTPGQVIIRITGGLFTLYALFYIFVIIRDSSSLSQVGKLISTIVIILFSILAIFAWTSEVKDPRFIKVRIWVYVFTLLALIVLKFRLIGRVINYFDYREIQSVLYGGAYFLTLIAMIELFVFYAFTLRKLQFNERAPSFLPVSAIVLFLLSLAMEAILFFVYGVCIEANALRTLVSRPIFYLGFIGLSLYFLFPQNIDTP